MREDPASMNLIVGLDGDSRKRSNSHTMGKT